MQAAILMNEELRLIIKEQTSRLDDEEQKKVGYSLLSLGPWPICSLGRLG